MAYFRVLIRKHESSPTLSHPKFLLFGALVPPRLEDPCLSAKAKKQTPSQAQSSYSSSDSQGGLPWSRPRVQAPRNERSGGQSAQGVRGDKRGHFRPISPRGPLTEPLPHFLLKRGKKRGESQVTPPLPCRSILGGRLQDFADFWDTWCPKDSPVPGIICHGLRLDFVSQPPSTSIPSPVVLPQDSAKASARRKWNPFWTKGR
jgi:hypothetical protein